MVMIHSFAEEAAKCRAQADEFEGRPEQPFLLRLSQAFEDLAMKQSPNDAPVFVAPGKRRPQ